MFRYSLLVLLIACVAACGRSEDKVVVSQTTPGPKGQEQPGERPGGCGELPRAEELRKLVRDAPGKGEAGGLFSGRYEWAAIVNRKGEPCALVAGPDDSTQAWPGSRAIALAKAYTANAFSTDFQPMSTARLYTLGLPGHSLWSAANGNPFNPQCLGAADKTRTPDVVCGGTITFGGGVPLYKGKTRVGGLGVSGDTPCADHEIAKRVRDAAGLNPTGGQFADDIQYTKTDGPTWYTHPLCPNTWRNGQKVGDEPVASGY